MSRYLAPVPFNDDLYSTSFSKIISAFSAPMCPATFAGKTQVYDAENNLCLNVAPEVAIAAGNTAAACGGAPFQVSVNGQCMSTNECPASPDPTHTCLNTQNIPAYQLPAQAPGVLYNMYRYA